jgi:hypothetical protein
MTLFKSPVPAEAAKGSALGAAHFVQTEEWYPDHSLQGKGNFPIAAPGVFADNQNSAETNSPPIPASPPRLYFD